MGALIQMWRHAYTLGKSEYKTLIHRLEHEHNHNSSCLGVESASAVAAGSSGVCSGIGDAACFPVWASASFAVATGVSSASGSARECVEEAVGAAVEDSAVTEAAEVGSSLSVVSSAVPSMIDSKNFDKGSSFSRPDTFR